MSKEKIDLSTPTNREVYWTKQASSQLLGRRIVRVRYLTGKEAAEMGWSERPVVLQLDDGNIVYPSKDDEGNGGGALFTNNEKTPILPVLPVL